MREIFHKLRRGLYWGLPAVILYLVFSQFDLNRLMKLGTGANPWLVLLGVSLCIPTIFLGALRWHCLARVFDCTRLTLGETFREYWFSLALGVFTPGSLGSDAYRVALGGRQTGRYLRGAFVIGVEKGAALFSCVVLIAGIYPFLTPDRVSGELKSVINFAYAALLLGSGILILAAITHRSRWLSKLLGAFWQRISGLARKAISAIPAESVQGEQLAAQPSELLHTLFTPRVVLPTTLLSLAIHVIGAIQGQVFLRALGYDLPFLINLFVAPLNVLALTLPITVGGVGVREGAFVLFYGAFGVPVEIALLVSFCSMLTVMFGYSIGGMILLMKKNRLQG